MAHTDYVPLPEKKENEIPIKSKISELSDSRAELMNKIKIVRTELPELLADLQSWRSKLDTQVKSYRDELSDLKKTLNMEVDQLRFDLQELRINLQQQQEEDVTISLMNLGLQNVSGDVKDTEDSKVKEETM